VSHRTFYLIRHGQTDWNLIFRWQGHTDIPLNNEGREQARRLGVHLRNVPFDRAISSDSGRAVETAKLALGGRSLPIETNPDLREFNAGTFEGLTWDEIKSQYPEAVTGMNNDWFGFVFPGGESRGAMQTRALAAFRQILSDGRGQHVLVTSHGMTVRGLLHGLFPETITHPMSIKAVENTSVSIIKQTPEGLVLVQMPDSSHLHAAAD